MLIRFRAAHTLAVLGVLSFAPAVHATSILSEGFGSLGALSGAGWVATNNSTAGGATGWFQGNTGIFSSQAGAPDSYIAANFNNAASGGDISNWLLTPTLTIQDGDTLSFWTRTETGAPFPDRLEVRLSTSGSSSDVGGSETSVGDFSTLLLSINDTLSTGGYPEDWTLYNVVVSGVGGPISGRYGFRYFVTDTDVNADYIGIDTVNVDSSPAPVPEPGTLLLMSTGGLALLRRRRRSS